MNPALIFFFFAIAMLTLEQLIRAIWELTYYIDRFLFPKAYR